LSEDVGVFGLPRGDLFPSEWRRWVAGERGMMMMMMEALLVVEVMMLMEMEEIKGRDRGVERRVGIDVSLMIAV
jgi:hypothetical protein